MSLFDRLSLKNRMVVSFSLIIILFVALSVSTIHQIEVLNRLTVTLYTHPLQVSNAALEAKAGVLAMHRSMKDVSTARSQADIALAIEEVREKEAVVYKELALIKQYILGTAGKQLIENTIALFDGWKPIRLEVQDFVLKGDTASANMITRKKGADYVARLEKRMEELTRYARNKADGFMQDARKTQRQVYIYILTAIIIFMCLAITIGCLLSSSILGAIETFRKTISRITRTGELELATVRGNHEIAALADHFNRLIRRLKEQFWLQRMENELIHALSGDLGFEALLEKGCDHLCQSLKNCAGAIYTYDAQTTQCRLSYYYAVPQGSQFAELFDLGEGLVGQAAKDKKEIMLTRPTPEEASVKSGGQNQTPQDIMAIPMMYENHLFGVFEVAFFDPVDTPKQQYLLSAIRSLSVLLYAAKQNEQVTRLFDSSQKANEKLQTLNTEIEHQSGELTRKNIELEHQQKQVEEANRLKSEFLSNISHELRTPLNSVNALSRVLMTQAGEKLTPEENNYLEIIERNGKRLLALINNILDLSKIEAGKVELDCTRFSLEGVVDNIVESLSPLARNKNIRLDVRLPETLPQLESDEAKVHQILENIIANAVKFTERGGVSVSALERNGHVEITIEDSGIGISSKDLKTIFEEFRQSDGTTTRKYEGTGLGLAIAHKAVRLLGGDINVSSVVDQGSRFIVNLPVSPSRPSREPLPIHSLPAVPTRQWPSILIVDDDPKTRDLLSDAFQKQGYNTLTAATGRQALNYAKTHSLLAITLDVIMPEMDGWEVLSQLKKDPDTAEIPVIIVTVSDDRNTGFALGAVGYVNKPLDREQLLSEIRKIYPTLPSTVMLVDDNDTERNQAALWLTREGVQVMTANSAEQCLDLLESQKPDIMVIDLIMPGMDGFALIKAVRANPETTGIPVLVLTAKDLTPQEKKILTMNASTILLKSPECSEQLFEQINTILKNAIQPRVPRPVESKPSTGRPVVLIVENNPDNRTTIKAILPKGLDIKEAVDGRQGLDMARALMPDLILLDMALPKMDGLEVVSALKQDDGTKSIPVVALTAMAMAGDRQRILKGGCDDYIPKPINPEALRKKVRFWLQTDLEE
ncbi:response regulator [uncultured Desulfobacter sp.]|uniref:response regulator n=1 Tax=uncultured Desulfobacter sp. TaxID=240139 RepID=UPI002AABC4B7|nr:response regulator [uncultured Desulfobacter sp.]